MIEFREAKGISSKAGGWFFEGQVSPGVVHFLPGDGSLMQPCASSRSSKSEPLVRNGRESGRRLNKSHERLCIITQGTNLCRG